MERFKYAKFLSIIWQIHGVVGIFRKGYFFSRDFGKLFISGFFELNNGGCSLVAERSVVVRMARVRFSASALRDEVARY